MTSPNFLAKEASALLIRLRQVKPFSLSMPMVRAASLSEEAEDAIRHLLIQGRKKLHKRVSLFIRWMQSPVGKSLPPAEAQKAYSILKLQFNALLDQLDIFADVLTQRGEHDTGIWLAGLDELAADALDIGNGYFQRPPLICYLDRGHGAAIRRARTRLPGGDKNPVGIIRVPRERMVSSGIASSLIHEVGHQGAALLELIQSMRLELGKVKQQRPAQRQSWELWQRWISEILADCWSVSTLGVGSTIGLMGVVSLPAYFVFRVNMDDPHPFPWIRVRLSCAIGRALYPDPQWDRLARHWKAVYPLKHLRPSTRSIIQGLEATMPEFVRLLIGHRSARLKGKALHALFPIGKHQPARLRKRYRQWQLQPASIYRERPATVFAVMGQMRADGKVSAEKEHQLLSNMLRHWAVDRGASMAPAGTAKGIQIRI
ncbi:MAG: hypothetical protein D6730_09500 [Bacteroidetes bacterium]|nr:MAG: hypothetical protein D6730_09500 [Bacteroidota bacterium]